jgi:putative membrane protein
MTFSKITRLACVAACCCAWASCSRSDSTQAAAATAGDEATPAEPSPSMTTLTDGQIMQAVATLHAGQMSQAEFAVTRSTSPRVRDYASEMLEQHRRAQQLGAEFAAESGATFASSALSSRLESQNLDTMQRLQAADVSLFDQAYMKLQLLQLQAALNTLDQQLIVAANTAAVRNQLTVVRRMTQRHMTQAEEVAATLTP